MHEVLLVGAAFLASAVEMIEALTIVLAVGVTRGWRSTFLGVGVALGALAVVVAALGPALAHLPLDALRLFIGGVLLIFGLQWLRKAILRASGLKSLHDEEAIFREEADAAGAAPREAGTVDWYSFTVAFKGVFLEGLEVAFIVVTFGSTEHHIGLAALGAAAAAVAVTAMGLALHAPLSRAPENTMKFGVGVMLTTFGMFWGAEGAGVKWPWSDAAILGLLVFTVAFSLLLVVALRRRDASERLGELV